MRAARKAAVTLVSYVAASSGVTSRIRTRRLDRSDHRVFILEYHDVTGDSREREGIISVERFRRHVRHLKRHFRFETMSQAADLLIGPERLDRDRVVLTFDDGYEGNHRWAWPVLREEAVPATFFVTSGFLDGAELWFDAARRALSAARRNPRDVSDSARRLLDDTFGSWPYRSGVEHEMRVLKYASPRVRERTLRALRAEALDLGPPARAMTWDQIRDLQQAGIEVGCHTVNHPILSTLDPAEQEREIMESRNRIAQETGVVPEVFAIPNGSEKDFDEHTLEIVRRSGLKAVCTTIRGSNRPGCDPMTLRRIGVGSDSLAVLDARMSGIFDQEIRSPMRWFGVGR